MKQARHRTVMDNFSNGEFERLLHAAILRCEWLAP
jgi:hypothetical protein